MLRRYKLLNALFFFTDRSPGLASWLKERRNK